jgi:hypothetical protein
MKVYSIKSIETYFVSGMLLLSSISLVKV